MHILIIYTSIEGQTRKIAETLSRHLVEKFHQVKTVNANEMSEFDRDRAAAIILAAPIHAGRYPSSFVNMVRRERAFLNSRPLALISVTLSIHSRNQEEREQAAAIPGRLIVATGIRPMMVHNAAGALRFSEYGFFKRWIMRRIAESEGENVDTSKDIEYTDWGALDAFADTFVTQAAKVA